jgi:dCTP deaminase
MNFVDFDRYELHPRQSVLACTEEVVRCPLDLSARIEGKSSLGRLFMAVHITAGVIDAGFHGQVTLEIVNHGPWTIVLWPSMPIAQVNYFQMTGPCEVPYGSKKLGSHYLGQRGPTPASGRRGK